MTEEKRFVLKPYGVYYYLDKLKSLKDKTEHASRSLFYAAPNVSDELEELTHLKNFLEFEEIGKWAREWLDYIQSHGLPIQACRSLYEQSVSMFNKFLETLDKEYILIHHKLEILDSKKVRKGAEAFFDEETIEWLKNIKGLTEFHNACRALLVGLPTAAGFYLLRLCERVLRELYKKETGKDITKLTWGAILDELENYYKDEKPNVLHIIKYLKEIRNSIAHPDKYLSQKRAEQLLNFAISVIEEVRRELL